MEPFKLAFCSSVPVRYKVVTSAFTERSFAFFTASSALVSELENSGTAMATSTATMATTTSSSASVKPPRSSRIFLIISFISVPFSLSEPFGQRKYPHAFFCIK